MELLTVQEAARMLRVNPLTVRRYIAAGRLPAVRVGKGIRIHMEAIEGLLAPAVPGPRHTEAASARGGGPVEAGAPLPPPLTVEERERGLAVVERLERLQEELLERYGGQLLTPSSWELLDEARDQRGRALG